MKRLLPILLLLTADPAMAAPEPLAALVRAARAHDIDVLVAEAERAGASAARDVDAGALWPRLEARLGYTRNQHDATITLPDGDGQRVVTITAFDQLEASATLTVPLLDLGRRGRLDATDVRLDGRTAGLAARRARSDEAVASAFYQGVFARARTAIAEAELATAEARHDEVEVRTRAGFASPLDGARAAADSERARRAIADAQLDEASARRQLRLLAGAEAVIDFAAPAPPAAAPSLETQLATVDALPEVRALAAEAEALRLDAHASDLDLVPTLDAFVADRLTNASGFGEANNVQVGLVANFRLDLPGLRRADALLAQARAADLRTEAARRSAALRIEDLVAQIQNRQSRIDAARAELAATEVAVSETTVRNREGASTALELATAERDRLGARLELARAEAELALAHVLLAIASGEDISADAAGRSTP